MFPDDGRPKIGASRDETTTRAEDSIRPKMMFKLKRGMGAGKQGHYSRKRLKNEILIKDKPRESIPVKGFSTSDENDSLASGPGARSEVSATMNDKQNEIHDFDQLLQAEGSMLSDTMMVMQSLIQSGNHGVIGPNNVPFLLQHIVQAKFVQEDRASKSGANSASSVMDKDKDLGASTLFTSDLRSLVEENLIRSLPMSSTTMTKGSSKSASNQRNLGDIRNEDIALVEIQRYKSEIINWMQGTNVREGMDLAQRFMILQNNVRQSQVAEKDLLRFLSKSEAKTPIVKNKPPSLTFNPDLADSASSSNFLTILNRKKDAKKDLETLIELGFLTPKRDTSMLSLSNDEHRLYYFSLPEMGIACKNLAGGRAEIYAKVKRSMYGELRISNLVQKNLKKTDFNPLFHIDDLVALGTLTKKVHASGEFVKLK